MAEIIDAFDSWLRDYVVDGVPASGINPPSKAEGRAIGGLIEDYANSQIAAAVFANAAFFQTLELSADAATFAVAAGVKHWRNPRPLLLTEIRASLTGADPTNPTIVDVKVNGTSIMTDLVQIDATAVTSVGSAAPMAIAAPNVLDNQEFEFDITAVGGAAAGLKVQLIGMTTTFGVSTEPFFVADGGFAAGGGTYGALAVDFPASGVEAGDIAILVVAQPYGNTNRPSGWNAMGAQISQANSLCIFAFSLYWRACTGAENGTSQSVTSDNSFSGAPGGSWSGLISIWRGCPAMGAPYEAMAENSDHGSVMTGEDVTTTANNERVVQIFWAIPDTIPSTPTSSPDVGWTVTAQGSGGLSADVIDAIPAPLPGLTVAEARTVSEAVGWASWSFALVPG